MVMCKPASSCCQGNAALASQQADLLDLPSLD